MSDKYIPAKGFSQTLTGNDASEWLDKESSKIFEKLFENESKSDAFSIGQKDQLQGRLNNMLYMAEAIDRSEGNASPYPHIPAGKRQYEFLLNTSKDGAQMYRLMYKAHQTGEDSILKTGVLLTGLDKSGATDKIASAVMKSELEAKGHSIKDIEVSKKPLVIGNDKKEEAMALPAPKSMER